MFLSFRILERVLCVSIGVLLIVCGGGALNAQGFDVLRLAGTNINAELNLKDNIEIYQSGNYVQLRIAGSLTLSRNFSPIRTTPPKIAKNLIIHIGVYLVPESNGLSILPESKRSDTAKTHPEYENEFPVTVSTDSPYNFPITFPTPKNDGVYEIVVSIYTQNQTPLPRSFTKPDIEIVRQIVVVNPEPKQQTIQAAANSSSFDKELIDQNNTQKNEWWKPNLKRLPVIPTPKLPSFIDRNPVTTISPPDNFRFAINKNSLANFFEQYTNQPANIAENNNSSKNENDTNIILHPPENSVANTWHVVPLNLHEIGKPHLIEIDYPQSIAQKLEIAVVETVDNEHVISAESCIHVTETVGQAIASFESGQNNTHRVLFWSKTKTPTLLFINRTKQNCIFSNTIRLFKITSNPIPRQYKFIPKRLVAGYLNRPETLLQLASTIEKSDPKQNNNNNNNNNNTESPKNLARNWQTLYESANRLVEVLHWNGFDGVMLNVASKDAILYKTDSKQPESQHDMLELLHRLFDREIFSLIPAINFNMRLPKIDKLIQNNPQLTHELLLPETEPQINPNINNTNINVTINNNETINSNARYNFLHPTVRETLLNTIRKITTQYSSHQSFGGIGIILAQDSHTLLNEPLKSLDDWTIHEFVKDTGTLVPDAHFAELRDRIEFRSKFFKNNNAALETFINWRNIKVKEFYQEVVKIITSARRDARLYLAADTILDQPAIKKFCLPLLSRTGTVLLSQRMLGYDPAIICKIPSLTFLRPSRRSPDMQNESAAVYCDFDSVNTGAQFIHNGISFGTLFFNDPDQSPSVPASIHNRRRFVKQLAQSDVAMFFDGGNSLLSGENDSLRDLLAVFRQLPALPFNTFSYPPNQSNNTTTSATIIPYSSAVSVSTERSMQPITIRYVNNGSGLFVYIVNDAPFEVRVDIEFKIAEDVGFYELSGRKRFETGTWHEGRRRCSFRIEAYNLMAVYINDITATINDVEVLRPEYICGVNGVLHKWVEQLGQRIQIARSGIKWDKLTNAGFDEVRERGKQNFKKTDLPKKILQESTGHFDSNKYEYSEYHGWQALSTSDASADIDATVKHNGNASLKLTCLGADKNICVSSDPFELPATGRLFVSFFVGIKNDTEQNSLVTANLHESNLTTSSVRTTEQLAAPLLFQVSVVGIGGRINDNNNGTGTDNELINRTFNMESLLKPTSRTASTVNETNNSIQWFKVVVPFDRLPMDGNRGVVLRFSLGGMKTVWIDDITLYQVAFTPEETNELFRLLSAADVRRTKYRISDLMTLFDSYWVQFLLHNTPEKNNTTSPNQIVVPNTPANNISGNSQIAMLPTPAAPKKQPDKPAAKSNIIQRIKSWITWK
ncbi:MAG: hypothetical protein LBC74_08860 [Planctomycetaceae bacterium]|jgi:hypothetical protein|nr:hypothetical protein [Planctomycetaceae bacterium]